MGRPAIKFDDHYIPVTECGCWLWLGGLDTHGYGIMSGNRKAHRFSYQRAFGQIPEGLLVCHRCDVRACVNPKHLFLGTPADNTRDAVLKGRHIHGRRHARAKLTDADVVAILDSAEPCFVLAERYGTCDTTISYIRIGRTWKHVPRPAGYRYVPYRAPGDHTQWGAMKEQEQAA